MSALKKAVIYARYSSHGQSEQSIEGQLRDCYSFAEREGYKVIFEYVDRALTGRSDDRPDFQRMISDASKRQFEYVIVWKLDRFARNRYDSAIYKARLKKHNIRVVSATENISTNPEGIMLEGMLESMAEYYSANLAQNVKRGQRESIIKGTYLGGAPPFGFKIENKRLVADPDKAEIVRNIFAQYADGVSKKDIWAELKANNVKNRSGRPLTLASLQHTLRNRKYIGEYLHDGQPVTGGCDQIIDIELFEAVQRMLDKRRRAPATAKAKEEYLLYSKAFCGLCGGNLIGESGVGKSGKTYHYYTCRSRKQKRNCEKNNEKKGFLEWYIVEQTVEYVLAPARIEYIAERLAKAYEKEFGDNSVRELEKRISKLDRLIDKTVDDFLDTNSKTLKQKLEIKIDELDMQKTDLELDLARLKLVNNVHFSKDQIISWLKIFCNGDPLDKVFQRKIISTFINSVFLFDDKIQMYYNMKKASQISYMEACLDMENIGSSSENVRISNSVARRKLSKTNTDFIFRSGVFGVILERPLL